MAGTCLLDSDIIIDALNNKRGPPKPISLTRTVTISSLASASPRLRRGRCKTKPHAFGVDDIAVALQVWITTLFQAWVNSIEHYWETPGEPRRRYSGKRFSSFVQDREILLVNKQPVAFSPGDLAQNAKLSHVL